MAALAFVAVGCGGGDDEVPEDAIAVVGDTEVLRADFEAYLSQSRKGYQQQKRPFPKAGSPEYNNLKQQIVDYLVRNAQYREEAQEMGIQISDKDVDKRLAEIKKQAFGNSEKRFQAELKKQGINERMAREIILNQLVADAISKKVTSSVRVTQKDIREYYNKNKSSFGTPETREVRHILVKDKATADRLYTQIRGGGNFAALAKKHSIDPGSKLQGGKLTVTKGQFVPPFEQTAFLLPTNSLSRPVKTQYGYHLIQPLGETKPARTQSLKEVEATIRQQLEQTKRSEALQKWAEEVRKEYKDKTTYQVGFAPPKTATGTTAANE